MSKRDQRSPNSVRAAPTAKHAHPLPTEWLALAALVALSLALFSNTLDNKLVYDDLEAITKNEAAHGLRNTVRIFTTPSWWSSHETIVTHWRPLTTWTYAVNYSAHGLEPAGYHVVNNVLHGVASWLLFLVLTSSGLMTLPALFVAVLFVLHPAHVEAVAWVNCRADLLAGLFMLASLLAHIRGRAALSVIAFALAGMAKETGFMTPFVLLAWDGLIGRQMDDDEGNQARGKARLGEYLAHASLLIAFLLIRSHFVGGAAEATVSKMASPLAGGADFPTRLLTGCYVIARYVWLLLWPAELSVDYGPDAITRVVSFADARGLLGLSVVTGFIAATIASARRFPHVSFALALAMIVIAPAANIVFPVGTIMAERLLYLPALAVCVPLGLWL